MSDVPAAGRWYVLITAADGTRRRWRKQGREHTLAAELGPVWVANFKPAMFQVLDDGQLLPRGADARALEVVSVALEAT
jgi:hypothetical protein